MISGWVDRSFLQIAVIYTHQKPQNTICCPQSDGFSYSFSTYHLISNLESRCLNRHDLICCKNSGKIKKKNTTKSDFYNKRTLNATPIKCFRLHGSVSVSFFSLAVLLTGCHFCQQKCLHEISGPAPHIRLFSEIEDCALWNMQICAVLEVRETVLCAGTGRVHLIPHKNWIYDLPELMHI